MSEATQVLGDYVSRTGLGDLPPDVLELAKLCLLDTIGAIAVGASRPGAQAVTAFSTGVGGGQGPSSVFGSERRCAPQMAALANGMMGHCIEIDDVHDESLTHPGVVVVPAALAVAEECGASGVDFLAALVLGYELVGRAGLGVGATAHMLRGFYPTGTSGVFGSAAAAGKLLGLDSRQLTRALGTAASFASGIVEYSRSGGDVKWLHAGRASESGVTAAYLARHGLTAPQTAIEGRYGFCSTFSDAPRLEHLLDGLGEDFKIRAITVKPYACCSDLHPIIDATREIMTGRSIDADDIRNISVESPTKVFELNAIDGTASIMAAKYSVGYTIGLTLTRDIGDPSIYGDAILLDPTLQAIQSKVRVAASSTFDAMFPKTIAARVTVELVDGSVLTAENLGARGSIHRRLTPSELRAKFQTITASAFSREAAEEIADRIDALENAADLHAIAGLIRSPARKPAAHRVA